MSEKQKIRKDNDPSTILMRWMVNPFTKLLAKTDITPNQITVLNFIILVPLIVYFFIQGGYLDNFIALFLMGVYSMFDLIDGKLARIKSMQSKFGHWLDGGLDRIFQFLILCVITLVIVRNMGSWQWLLPGLGVLFGQNIANFIGSRYENDFGFDVYSGSEEFNRKFSGLKKISFLDSFLKNIIVPSNLFYIFFFTARYLLLLGILFNRLDIFLIAFAITINIRWLTMYFLYLRYLYGTESKLYTVKFLRELYFERNRNIK